MLANGLVPALVEGELTGLRAALESGVPTVRNRVGGHGQGQTMTSVPMHIARYALNLTAGCVLLLAAADASLA
jgi:hypothetical protein